VEYTLLRQQFLEILSEQQGTILSSVRDDKYDNDDDEKEAARESKMEELMHILREVKGLCSTEVRVITSPSLKIRYIFMTGISNIM